MEIEFSIAGTTETEDGADGEAEDTETEATTTARAEPAPRTTTRSSLTQSGVTRPYTDTACSDDRPDQRRPGLSRAFTKITSQPLSTKSGSACFRR